MLFYSSGDGAVHVLNGTGHLCERVGLEFWHIDDQVCVNNGFGNMELLVDFSFFIDFCDGFFSIEENKPCVMFLGNFFQSANLECFECSLFAVE